MDSHRGNSIKKDSDEILSKLSETFFTDSKLKMNKPSFRKERRSKRFPIKILAGVALLVITVVSLTIFIISRKMDAGVNPQGSRTFGGISKTIFNKFKIFETQKKLTIFSEKGINHGVVKNIQFSGSAIEKNMDKHIEVASGKGPRWASVYFGFQSPLNLVRHHLLFKTKGDAGGEELIIMFRDEMYKLRQIEVAEEGLSTEWQEFSIDLDSVGGIRTEQIKDIRFEFGGSFTGNKPGTIIFLKDIYFIAKQGTLAPKEVKEYDTYEEWYIPDRILSSSSRSINQLLVSDIVDNSADIKSKSLELVVDFPRTNSWREIYIERLIDSEDWNIYRALSAKIFLPEDAPRNLKAKFILTCGRNWYWTEMKPRTSLKPGDWNLIEANLESISIDWRYRGDISELLKNVRKLGIRIESDYSRDYKGSIYVKDIELIK